MSKRNIIIVVIVCMIIVFVGLYMANIDKPPHIYTIKIKEPSSVEKIIYQHSNGDVYEITDEEVIQDFINEANNSVFEIDDYLGESSWSASTVSLYNSDDEKILSIMVYSNNEIVYGKGPHTYKSKKSYGLEYLQGQGNFVKNIYD